VVLSLGLNKARKKNKLNLLIGVDLGTSETKAGLFDLEGNLLRLARREYPILTGTEPGYAEQDPETWWKAVCETLREIARGVDASDLAALCVQGQGPSLVTIDAQGRPLNNTILWMDARTTTERDELSKRLGVQVSPFTSLPQAMWLKRHRAEAYHQARWFLTSWDFVAYRLCGQAASSILASFHPFPPQELSAAELPASLFAPAVEAGRPIAGLTSKAARQTGLPEGLPVVAGTHDGMATFIGAGLVDVGRAADVNGTSGGLALCWNGPIEERGIFSTAWIHPGEYIVGGAMAALGKALDWYRDLVAGPEASLHDLIEGAMTTPLGADGLIFLPYLAGERAPIWDPQARGVLFGLTLQHTRHHVARAVLESVAFAIRHLAERLVEAGARISEMRVCGGQAQSASWNQIKADVTGLPVAVPQVTEAALMGAAVLAGVGAGLVSNVTPGANQMVHINQVLEPDPKRHQHYTHLYRVYARLYPDLCDTFHQLNEITREPPTLPVA
jgi:xylulokinase